MVRSSGTVHGSLRFRAEPVRRRRRRSRGPALAVAGLLTATLVPALPASAAPVAGPDIDGDRRADLVVGADDAVAVLEGDGTKRVRTAPSPGRGTGFGGVTAVGDFDGDGYDDVAVGEPWAVDGNGGSVWVHAGGPRGTLGGSGAVPVTRLRRGMHGMPGSAESAFTFGDSLAAGDLTGDGIDDLAVGAPLEGVGLALMAGTVTVVPGSRSGLRPRLARVLTQNTPGVPGGAEMSDLFGAALAIGDVTGDGRLDLAVSSPGENQRGMVHVLPGSSGGPTGRGATAVTAAALGIRAVYGGMGPEFGAALAVGDLTGDGRGDLVVGAPYAVVDGTSVCGKVAVLRGGRAGISATRAQVRSQSSPRVVGVCEDGDAWGMSLAVGDLTGDGRPELVVGAPYESVGALNGGGAYTVLRPSAHGVTGTRSFGVTQSTRGVPGFAEKSDMFAYAITLVDVDGDRRLDVVAGAPGEVISARHTGSVTVLSSAADGRPGRRIRLETGRSFTPVVSWLGMSLGGSPAAGTRAGATAASSGRSLRPV